MKKKILLVEDTKSVAFLVKAVLCDNEVIHVISPEKGLRLALNENFDLVITDVDLKSNLTGFDLIDRIRSFDSSQLFLVMSGELDWEKEADFRNVIFVGKPFRIDNFRNIVEGLLNVSI